MNRPTSQKQIRIFCILSFLCLASASQSPVIPQPILSPTSSPFSQHSLHPSILPYHTLPIYGNSSLGYYYVNIYIGNPIPQPQSVIIDTGSGLLALPCADCQQCGHKNHIHPPYDYNQSQTSTILTCESTLPYCQSKCQSNSKTSNCSFSIHYTEGSALEGIMVQDQIRLQTKNNQSTEQIRTYFGCTQKQTKLFYDQKANGIFGLSPKRDSSILQQIFSKHSPFNGQKHIFSICLASNGGIMTVGSINKNIHPDKLQPDFSIPYSDKTNLYSLQGVNQMMVGQTLTTSIMDRIGGSHEIFIVSGATFSYLPDAKYKDVQRILNSTCIASKTCSIGAREDSICYKLSLQPNQLLQQIVDHLFPTISFNINNKQLKWAPRKYMLVREAKNNEICLGILSLNKYLLGANWMQGRDIVFDNENKLVHIFNDVECVANATSMSQYVTLQNNPDLTFINKRQSTWEINTSSVYFMLGIGCFILSLLIGIIIMIGSSRMKKAGEIRVQDEQQDRTVGSMERVQIREYQQKGRDSHH